MKRRSLKIKSRAAILLQDLGYKLDEINLGLTRPGLVLKFGYEGAWDYLEKKEKYLQRQALKRLEERKLIHIDKIGNEYELRFTYEGIDEFIRLQILQSPIHEDGSICMVAFDIPEKWRQLRWRTRQILKSAGFKQLQKSVWISNRNAAEPLMALFTIQGKNDWIKVYTASPH